MSDPLPVSAACKEESDGNEDKDDKWNKNVDKDHLVSSFGLAYLLLHGISRTESSRTIVYMG